jgi:hypothetical protein
MVRALGDGDVAAAIGARIAGSSDHFRIHNTTHWSRRAAHCDAALSVVTLLSDDEPHTLAQRGRVTQRRANVTAFLEAPTVH